MKICQGLKMLSQIKNHLPTAERRRRRKVTQILRGFFLYKTGKYLVQEGRQAMPM